MLNTDSVVVGTLIAVLWIMSFMAVVCWAIAARTLPLVRPQAALFALANGLLGIGLYLMGQRDHTQTYMTFQLAAFTNVIAFTIVRIGVQMLGNIPITTREHLLAPIAYLVFSYPLDPVTSPLIEYETLFGICTGFIFFRIWQELFRTQRPVIGTFAAAILGLPTLIYCLMLLVRVAGYFIAPETRTVGFRVTTTLWPQVILLQVNNATMFGWMVVSLIRQIRTLSDKDALTGLVTWRALEKRLREEILRSQRNNQAFALIHLDLDHFKAVNDRYGHSAGDALLQHVASLLGGLLREIDAFARIGGEEFLVLLPLATKPDAATVAERMRRTLENSPLRWRDQLITLTASFGVVDIRPSHAIKDRVRIASATTNLAKAAGRNTVLVPDSGGVGQ